MTIPKEDCDITSTEQIEPGDTVVTRGRNPVNVVSVRHTNDTVTIGERGHSIIVSIDEIAWKFDEDGNRIKNPNN